jgi:hypothetical protein
VPYEKRPHGVFPFDRGYEEFVEEIHLKKSKFVAV